MGTGNWAGMALAGLALTGCGAGPSLQVDPWGSHTAASVRTVANAGGKRAIILGGDYAEIPASGFSDSVLGLLAAHGFTRADTGSADLWLRAHLLLKRGQGRQQTVGRLEGRGHRGGGMREAREGREAGPGPEAAEVRTGRGGASSDVEIVLELVRRTTGDRVWSGTATARLAHPFWSPEGRQELLALAGQLLTPVHGAAGA